MNDKTKVNFCIKLAEYLPNDMEQIYVVGNHQKLGNWNPNKAKVLKKKKDGSYCSFCELPVGTNLEFKVIKTLDWDHVEVGAFCEMVENHVAEVNNDTTLEVTVYNWKEN